MATQRPIVGVIMGSRSDWETMRHACETLDALRIPYEQRVVSAHRTPTQLFQYADRAQGRGIEVIIAGAWRRGSLARHDCESDMPSCFGCAS